MKVKLVSIIITLCMVFAIMPITALAAPITLDVSEGNIVISEENANGYIITGTTTQYNVTVTAKKANITIKDLNIAVIGFKCAFAIAKDSTVNLTLSGANTLTSGTQYAGLWVPVGASVTIQSAMGDSTDSLTAKGGGYAAGIGGSAYYQVGSAGADCGEITINSGTVEAIGSNNGAGIGGGNGGNGGIVEISAVSDNYTIVTATGESGRGAGIGGGARYDLTDGEHKPTGETYGGGSGKTHIKGGTVTATGDGSGAGIGAGQNGTGGDGVDVTIDGGIVTANGGDGNSPGIGGNSVDVIINGGSVTATGSGVGAGIGADFTVPCGNITITGGTVVATAVGSAPAIGTRQTDNEDIGDITITGGKVTANGSENHYGIAVAGRRSINISNATVIAKGGAGATRQQPNFGYSVGYQWRTSGSGIFNSSLPYTWSEDHTYFEIQILVSGVEIDKATLALNVGDTETLTATITPDNATNKAITWSSSDEAVATVDENGVVVAVGAGVATITATTANGYTATCDVTVTEIISEESGGILGFLRMVKMILELIIYIMGVFA